MTRARRFGWPAALWLLLAGWSVVVLVWQGGLPLARNALVSGVVLGLPIVIPCVLVSYFVRYLPVRLVVLLVGLLALRYWTLLLLLA